MSSFEDSSILVTALSYEELEAKSERLKVENARLEAKIKSLERHQHFPPKDSPIPGIPIETVRSNDQDHCGNA